MDGIARRARLARSRLYFVVGRADEELLEAALRGGVDVVQLRDKGLSDEELVAAAQPFRRACDRHGALFVLNDRPELVERCGADGVHVGQGDASVAEARRLVGAERIVGLSTHSREQMQDAGDADYIGVGTIFATPTKPEDDDVAGLELVRVARDVARLPWFAIGGIDRSNVAELVRAGAAGVAVVRAIRDAADPQAAARALRAELPPTEAVVGDEDVLLPQIDWLHGSGGGAAPHVHAEHADVFHVLEGTMEFRAGDGTVRLPPGSTLAAPPLLAHGFRLPAGDARYLNLHAPGGWARERGDTFGLERADARVRPAVSAPGDGDRLAAPHRLALVKVDLPELALVESVVDDAFEGPELHLHLRHADCFHVLEGALEFSLGGRRGVRVEAGTSVVVPPGVAHTFGPAARRARYLNAHAPSLGFVDYVRAADRGEHLPFDQYAFR
ncbi:MAG TPA: thiamine phosphate synthase [Gaiellaceae bacterium]|nr:thiamine phosphate synthase [Gaiellaceae bacterium]